MYRVRFKSIRFGLISFFIIIFQSTLVQSLALGAVKPDFVLLLVIFFSLYKGPRQGMFYGIVVGLFVDALSGGVSGINSFVFGCLGFVSGLLKERVYINHLLTKLLIGLSAGIFYMFFYYVLAIQFFQLPNFLSSLDIVLGTIIYTSVCNILFADVLDRLVIVRSTSLL
jgi:rod shape-determining protein MreD